MIGFPDISISNKTSFSKDRILLLLFNGQLVEHNLLSNGFLGKQALILHLTKKPLYRAPWNLIPGTMSFIKGLFESRISTPFSTAHLRKKKKSFLKKLSLSIDPKVIQNCNLCPFLHE